MGEKTFVLFMDVHGSPPKKQSVRVWGLYAILLGGEQGERERHFWKKQMAFVKNKRDLRRMDRRYDSFVTAAVY